MESKSRRWTSALEKTLLREWKDGSQPGRKYLQIINMTSSRTYKQLVMKKQSKKKWAKRLNISLKKVGGW